MSGRHDSGFTLVELLVVIAIIGILGALGLTMLSGARRDADDQVAEGFIQAVGASLELYKNDRRNGVYPPTSLEGFPGLGRLANRSNLGIEALCVCLNSKGFKGEPLFDKFEEYMDNIDGDQSAKPMTHVAAKDLFEMVDPWGMPYAYFNAIDYDNPKVRQYTSVGGEGDDEELVTVKPHINPKTKSPYKLNSYQLFSAGADQTYNTEDDIGNW